MLAFVGVSVSASAQSPAAVTSPIDFDKEGEAFAAGFEFNVGENYFPMPAWGWPDDNGTKMGVVEKDCSNVLKVEPKNSDLTAIFKTLNFPSGKTFGDIESISFNTFFESFSGLDEGDDVMGTEVILYFGRPNTILGNGTGFANPYCISFKGNPEGNPKAGVIGAWFKNTVTMDDILDPAINKGGGNYGMAGWGEVADRSSVTFGVGFNANNGVYYIDDIVFCFYDDYCDKNYKSGCKTVGVQKVDASSSSVKVYAIPGGLAIEGGEGAVIYGIDGILVTSTSASTIALPQGIYIVKVGGEVVKAIVK